MPMHKFQRNLSSRTSPDMDQGQDHEVVSSLAKKAHFRGQKSCTELGTLSGAASQHTYTSVDGRHTYTPRKVSKSFDSIEIHDLRDNAASRTLSRGLPICVRRITTERTVLP